MSTSSHAEVQIAAPAAEVFTWLVEPAKLTQWAGGAGAMPADPTQLAVGYRAAFSMQAPDGLRQASLAVTRYQPPTSLGLAIGYDGGQSTTEYSLTEAGGETTLVCDTTSDFGSPDLSSVEAPADNQPRLIGWILHHELQHAERMLSAGGIESALQQSMERLAALVTGTAPPAIPSPGEGFGIAR